MKTSNCCESSVIEETDICKKCGEHCEPQDSIEQIQQENRKLILMACNPKAKTYREAQEQDYGLIGIYRVDNKEFRCPDSYVGKPRFLSRVLLALNKCGIEATYYPNPNGAKVGIFDAYDEDREIAWWDLTKGTLEEQSEETQREINNLLKGE